MKDKWIPVDERLPETNKYILLSFYIGDETETCVSQLLFVNAWMELPEPYKECEKE